MINAPSLTSLPSITGGQGGSAGPSTARNGDGIFDNSGWQVFFGNDNKATSSKAGELGSYLPYVLAAAGVLIAWRLTRR